MRFLLKILVSILFFFFLAIVVTSVSPIYRFRVPVAF